MQFTCDRYKDEVINSPINKNSKSIQRFLKRHTIKRLKITKQYNNKDFEGFRITKISFINEIYHLDNIYSEVLIIKRDIRYRQKIAVSFEYYSKPKGVYNVWPFKVPKGVIRHFGTEFFDVPYSDKHRGLCYRLHNNIIQMKLSKFFKKEIVKTTKMIEKGR